ncbi:MAG: hypothetical protein NWE92_11475 [Candidatus Bathyarchaeota archaeon]|nr:hypothetical protein [Candidatus Bathyarchaeota archaeon]
MKQKTVIAVATTLIVVILVLVGASQIDWAPQKDSSPTATPSASPAPTAEVTPTPTATPVETIAFKSVSVDSSSALSVEAYSESEQEIIVTQLTLKDADGKTLATDTTVQSILPADGTVKKLTINQNNVALSYGGGYSLTLTTSNGNSFTSPQTLSGYFN